MKQANMWPKIAVVSAILLALLAVGIAYAATIVVDSFDTGTQVLWVDSVTTTASNSLDTTSALGGERDVYLQWVGGNSAQIQVNVDYGGTSDRFAYTAGDGMTGRAAVVWDGNNDGITFDPQGLANVNLVSSNPANNGILARVIFADLRSQLTMRVYADTAGTNWSYSTVNLPPVNPGTRMDVLFPFSSGWTVGNGTGADFTNVGAVVMVLDGIVDQGVDVSIDFVEASNALEYGDLPEDVYGTDMLNANHIPQGLRLGPNCDAEATYNSSTDALGDDNNQGPPDDEDGVTPSGTTWQPASFAEVTLNIKGCANVGRCYVNGWIDWNNDGDFNDTVGSAAEHVVNNYNRTDDAVVARPVLTPDNLQDGWYYARFRICRTSTACDSPDNTDTNVLDGEVEDYRWYLGPTAVELASFTAAPQGKAIAVGWETVSEVDNLGFNLYRAESRDGAQRRLNDALIPSKGPGSPIGFTYSFTDQAVRAGRTYYYWLEAVDLNGGTTRFGPVSAAIPLLIGVPKTKP